MYLFLNVTADAQQKILNGGYAAMMTFHHNWPSFQYHRQLSWIVFLLISLQLFTNLTFIHDFSIYILHAPKHHFVWVRVILQWPWPTSQGYLCLSLIFILGDNLSKVQDIWPWELQAYVPNLWIEVAILGFYFWMITLHRFINM